MGLVLFAFQMIIRDDLDKIQVREVLFIQLHGIREKFSSETLGWQTPESLLILDIMDIILFKEHSLQS